MRKEANTSFIDHKYKITYIFETLCYKAEVIKWAPWAAFVRKVFRGGPEDVSKHHLLNSFRLKAVAVL